MRNSLDCRRQVSTRASATLPSSTCYLNLLLDPCQIVWTAADGCPHKLPTRALHQSIATGSGCQQRDRPSQTIDLRASSKALRNCVTGKGCGSLGVDCAKLAAQVLGIAVGVQALCEEHRRLGVSTTAACALHLVVRLGNHRGEQQNGTRWHRHRHRPLLALAQLAAIAVDASNHRNDQTLIAQLFGHCGHSRRDVARGFGGMR
mmetsp:Transcript_120060/g.339703  ORF Transcript_120060/g.339703 Transcript_120060/m.339703 type:complete len:204 (+) Transcript_120060:149-760(+)